MTTENVLIAGCGYVGNELARRLASMGHAVWGLRRSVNKLPPGIHPISADLSDPESLSSLPAQFDVVVYSASADGYSEEAYQRAYVDGVRNVVHALRAQNQSPRVFLFTSSTGVYGQTDGSDVTEDSPAQPLSFSGRAMLDGEAVVAGLPWTSASVRLGGIYGPGRTRFLGRVKRGETPIPADDKWTNRIHRDDCAGVLHHLIGYSENNELHNVYIGVDDAPVLKSEVIRWLAAHMDAPEPEPADSSESSKGKRPRTNKRCLNTRIKQSGYEFEVPSYKEGYGAMIEGLGW